MRSMENWGGQAKKFHDKEIRGLYLQMIYPKQMFNETKKKLSKIPILKAGTQNDLKALSYDDRKINLINTCAFDCVFQLFLCLLYDSDNVHDTAKSLIFKCPFLKMLVDVSRDWT